MKQQYANVKKPGKLQFTFYERNLFVSLQQSNLCFCTCFSRLFWAQMELATLAPFQGPKKSRFLDPPPLKCPLLWIVPLPKPVRTAPYKQQVH